MKEKLRALLTGLVIGVVIAFPLGMNYGRGAPLLSNPFASQDVKSKVKSSAQKLLKDTKESIHDATK